MARGQRGNPAASLRVHQLHATPVLFSGLATLVLNKAEKNVISAHYKCTVQRLQRLHQNTPRAGVFLLAGCLPGEDVLHQRQLGLLSMICHMPILHFLQLLTQPSHGSNRSVSSAPSMGSKTPSNCSTILRPRELLREKPRTRSPVTGKHF